MANAARISVVWRRELGEGITNLENVCTFHVQSVPSRPAYDDAELVLLCTAVRDWWNLDGPFAPRLSDAYPIGLVLDRIEARRVLPTPSDAVGLYDQNLPGTGIGQGLYPPQVCWGITLKTLVDSRSGRGRLYLPAAEDTDPDVRGCGLVPATLRQALAHQAADLANEVFNSALGAGEAVLSVYSRALVDPNPVTSFAVANRLRTQRRRARGTVVFDEFGLDGEPPA